MEDGGLCASISPPSPGPPLSSGLSPASLDDESSFMSDFPLLIVASRDLPERQSEYYLTAWLPPQHGPQERVTVSQDHASKTKCLSRSVASTQSMSGCCPLVVLPQWLQSPCPRYSFYPDGPPLFSFSLLPAWVPHLSRKLLWHVLCHSLPPRHG